MTAKERRSAYAYKIKNIVIPVIFYCGIAGILAGLTVAFFNRAANLLTGYSNQLYGWFKENPAYIPLLFVGLAALAGAMWLVHKFTPEVRGSGIPQTEGVMRGLLTFRWLRVLISTCIGGFISFFAGLSLGSEGPSVQIGATTAQGAAKLMKARAAWQRYVVTGGASAGLAVAFNAPLTGILFAIEEGHRRVTPMLLLSASSSVIFATIVYRTVAQLWGGADNMLFELGVLEMLPINQLWMLFLLGLGCGAAAIFFNFAINRSQRATDKIEKKTPYWARLLVAFLLTGVVGLLLTDANTGGHGLIEKIAEQDFTIQMLLLLLVVKMVMIVICFNSGATGGMFIPMLAIGALVGGIFGKLFMLWGMDPDCYKLVVCVAMTTFFGASVRAPITAIVLIVEITGYNAGFLPASIAIFTAFLVAELLGNRPLYDEMLERTLERRQKKETKDVRMEVEIELGSFLAGKSINDVLWPANCLVTKVIRGDESVIADGEMRLEPGDIIVIKANTDNVEKTFEYIQSMIK